MKQVITLTLNPCLDKTIEIGSLVPGGLNRVLSHRTDVGGKGINVSKVLSNFGVKTVACGLLPETGSAGFLAALERQGISHDFFLLPGALRTNYKLREQQGGQVTEINESGPEVSVAHVTLFLESMEKKLANASVLVLSGSVPPGVPKDFYGRLCAMGAKLGIPTIVDADGEQLREAIRQKPYAIKPNLFELEQLCGHSLESEQAILSAARELIAGGVSLVVVSMGAEGALFVTKEETARAIPPKVSCLSTVGAGDSMVAAVACALEQNLNLQMLARLATAAGTVTATCPGTEVCDLAAVRDMEKRIVLR